MIGLSEFVLLLAAIFATAAVITRDEAYSAFSLGSAILFASLFVMSEVSTILGIIIFTVYTASVVGLVFLGIGEENGGISKYSAAAIPLAFAIAIILARYLPEASVGYIELDISSIKDLIIPIAAVLASVIVSGEEVRGE